VGQKNNIIQMAILDLQMPHTDLTPPR